MNLSVFGSFKNHNKQQRKVSIVIQIQEEIKRAKKVTNENPECKSLKKCRTKSDCKLFKGKNDNPFTIFNKTPQ